MLMLISGFVGVDWNVNVGLVVHLNPMLMLVSILRFGFGFDSGFWC